MDRSWTMSWTGLGRCLKHVLVGAFFVDVVGDFVGRIVGCFVGAVVGLSVGAESARQPKLCPSARIAAIGTTTRAKTIITNFVACR